MLSFLRFSTVFALLAFAALAICENTVHAYVVIDNFDAGAEALGTVASGVDGTRDRATGVVAGDQSDRFSTDTNLLFPGSNSRRSGKSLSSRSSGRTMLSYRSTSSRKSGGSASGGGSGSSRGRRSSTRSALNQPIVDVSTPQTGASQSTGISGMNVTHFDSGSDAGGGSGMGSGSSGGGDGSDEEPPVGPDPDILPDHLCPVGPPVSGTPEPAALVVWAIAGCCGYGFLRISQRRLPLK